MRLGEFTSFARDFELNTHTGRFDTRFATKLLQEEVEETVTAIIAADDAEILDGFGDVAFIAINGIYKHLRNMGYDDLSATAHTGEVLRRICFANNGKRQPDGLVARDGNGKVIKPDGWTPPAYGDIITGVR